MHAVIGLTCVIVDLKCNLSDAQTTKRMLTCWIWVGITRIRENVEYPTVPIFLLMSSFSFLVPIYPTVCRPLERFPFFITNLATGCWIIMSAQLL